MPSTHSFSHKIIATALALGIIGSSVAFAAQSDVINAVSQIRQTDPNVPLSSNQKGNVGTILDNIFGTGVKQGKILSDYLDLAGTANYMPKYAGTGNGFVNSQVFDNGTNVGIGTSSPTAKLDVNGTIKVAPTGASVFQTNVSNRDFDFYWNNSSNRVLTVHSWPNAGSSYSNIIVDFYGNDGTNNIPGFTLLRNGNVGIGTSSPSAKLDVRGSLGVVTSSDSVANFQTTDDSWLYTQWLQSNGTRRAWMGLDNTLGSFTLGLENGTSSFTIPSGNVGIGTSSPGAKLDVNGAIKAYGSSIFAQNDNSSRAYWAAPIQLREAQYGGSSAYLPPRISLHWGGVVASQIGIESSWRIAILNNPGTGYENLVANAMYAQNYFYESDRRLKENIVPLDDALGKIRKLNGYTYDWKSSKKSDIGVIAQEVEEVYPQLVGESKDGSGTTIKTVEYGNLVAPLIEATKTIANTNDAQDKEIAELKAQIAELKQVVKHLESSKK